MIRQNIRSAYTFQGRCSHRQYNMPKKPAKYIFKFKNIICCESSYLLDTIPSLGKSNENDQFAKN